MLINDQVIIKAPTNDQIRAELNLEQKILIEVWIKYPTFSQGARVFHGILSFNYDYWMKKWIATADILDLFGDFCVDPIMFQMTTESSDHFVEQTD